MENRTKNILVDTKYRAFARALDFLPCTAAEDKKSSERAGYPIYRGIGEENFYNYICDLGDHYEVNIGAKSINVWFKESDNFIDECEDSEPAGLELTAEQLEFIKESLNSQLEEEISGIANAGPGTYAVKLLRKANKLVDLIEYISQYSGIEEVK